MYFTRFPKIKYEFLINNKKVIKTVKDITINVRIQKEILSNYTLYDEYDLRDGDTPEIISYKLYDTSIYHWVVMLCNLKFDWRKDFPLPVYEFEEYLKDKYKTDINNLYNQIHHYEDLRGFVVNDDYVVPAGFPESGYPAIPITVYNYESQLNDNKRRIKVISKDNLNVIIGNFKDLIK
jgi:hypothetical protein